MGICLGNSHDNFELHRFTTGENIEKSFRRATFLTHTVHKQYVSVHPISQMYIKHLISNYNKPSLIFKCSNILQISNTNTQYAISTCLFSTITIQKFLNPYYPIRQAITSTVLVVLAARLLP